MGSVWSATSSTGGRVFVVRFMKLFGFGTRCRFLSWSQLLAVLGSVRIVAVLGVVSCVVWSGFPGVAGL